MSEGRITTSAIIRVTIEVPADSVWGPESPLSQVFKQAGEETVVKVSDAVRTIGGRIVGKIEVVSVSSVTPR